MVLMRQPQQRHGVLHGGYSRPSGQPRSGHGGEIERCGGDDAQRDFTANNHEIIEEAVAARF